MHRVAVLHYSVDWLTISVLLIILAFAPHRDVVAAAETNDIQVHATLQ